MNIDMIRAAAARLTGRGRVTPLLNAPLLDEIAGRRVWVKAECLQHTGSFKYRGAWSAISALPDPVRRRGVLAISSGNHAQGIALAAAQHDAPAVVIMPADAPALKIANTRALGAEVVTYNRDTEDREALGAALSAERGLHFIRPFDDPEVIAGQGTAGLEIAKQAQAQGITSADVLVCCGGGGLTAGIALALAADAPGLRARPVEPEGFDDAARSLEAGRILRNAPGSDNICDAIVTPQPGDLTFPIMQAQCGPGLRVSEDDVLFAMAQAFLRLKVVAEPGGAVALAAALRQPDQMTGDDVIVTISGGNVDPAMFARALTTLT